MKVGKNHQRALLTPFRYNFYHLFFFFFTHASSHQNKKFERKVLYCRRRGTSTNETDL